MRQFLLSSVPVFLLSFTSLSQTATSPTQKNDNTTPLKNTRIVRVNDADTVLVHVEMQNADYDPSRNAIPFFTISKVTPYDQFATPTLGIKRTTIVSEPYASIIRKRLGGYITSKFEITPTSSLARNENLNKHKLIPFRYNSNYQLEELIDYEIAWQTSSRPGAASRGASPFKNNSVLASGTWFKIAVTKDGIHKINKTFLNALGLNGGFDPRNIRIYGNGGKMLPELNSDPRIDDLEENAIRVVGESDGIFDAGDYVLFYATGPSEWKRKDSASMRFRATKNLYSDTSFYFLNVDLGPGKRVSSQPSSGVANVSTSSYDFRDYHEENIINFGKSGREFFGEYFDITNSYTFTWDDGDFVVGDTIATETRIAAAYLQYSDFNVNGNGLDHIVTTAPITDNTYADYASLGRNVKWALNSTDAVISITVSKLTSKSLGWLDKLTINARRRLDVAKQFSFRDTRISGPGKVCAFSLTMPLNTQVTLWNVTDPLNAFEQQFNATSSTIDFVADASSLQEYCASPSTDFYSPVYVGKIANQNLHSIAQADYVVVTHPLFIKEAQRIAQFHEKQDGLTYAVVTTDQIYNEFSSGRQDISAIRDFIRMLYTRNVGTGREVKYVLLMGDGSYNNKSRNLVNNSNLIPTYESYNSLVSTTSVATDDFYALMDADEGFLAEAKGEIDLGVGRFPCRTVSEVRAVIAKIENYYSKDANFQVNATDPANCNNLSESTMGDWRNWLLFLADDQDGALHMHDADSLTRLVKNLDPSFNIDKIFLDAYQRFSTPGGARYPDASEDFQKRIKKGALIFNYTGHGGEVGLTAERMVDLDIINNLDNLNKLALFITATCEFSRYDDPGRTSAGELCLLNPKGGAIALFTTCRLAYSNFNLSLNVAALQNLFKKLPDGSRPTLGEAIRLTKNDPLVTIPYITNFHLLGDPALTLSYPENKVYTSEINSVPVTPNSTDTLSALSKVTIKGYVSDQNGNKLTGFNGLAYPTVFDKENLQFGLLNTDESAANYNIIQQYPDSTVLRPFVFKMQKNILYRGKALVTNGDFSFTFIVPKDISFAPGPGKISYYATNGQTDGSGYYQQVVVGGLSKNAVPDNAGPQVSLYMNDKGFVNGGVTSDKPVFYADLIDSSGINTLGSGIGHDISVVLDGKDTKPLVLNDYYEANLNSYQSGRVRYPYSQLAEGEHKLAFKVWDIQNNSSDAQVDFVVARSAELALKHVLNYPNPFTTRTKFFFEHNQACSPLKVTVQVYTVSGKLVKTIQQTVVCEGFRPGGIEWDGRDDFGDKLGRGVYLYKLAIIDVENKKAEKIEKLVILN
jgi:hypothetical protein